LFVSSCLSIRVLYDEYQGLEASSGRGRAAQLGSCAVPVPVRHRHRA